MISVITITRNRAHLIGETLKSVLSQSFQDFELIIIDDNSEDNTEEVISTFNDSRIKYFICQGINKLSRLRNIGMSKAKGDFISFIDSDDIWEENKLQLQMEMLKGNPNSGFSFHSVSIFNDEIVINNDLYSKNSGSYTGNIFKPFINNKITIYPSTLLIRRSSLNKINIFDEKLEEGDHDLIARLSYNFLACIIYKPLAKIRKHNENINPVNSLRINPFLEYISTLNFFYKHNQISKSTYKKMLGYNNYMIGNCLLQKNNFSKAKDYYLLCCKSNPASLWSIKAFAKYLITRFKKI